MVVADTDDEITELSGEWISAVCTSAVEVTGVELTALDDDDVNDNVLED